MKSNFKMNLDVNPLQIDFKLFLANSPVLYLPENTIKRLVFSFLRDIKWEHGPARNEEMLDLFFIVT